MKLDRNNLHHAYLLEGDHFEVLPEILKFIEDLGIKTSANPDFLHISVDSFKMEDARNLKSFASEKGFTGSKKIFIISANSFLLEAQNSLLKIFEEPIENTHFFLIMPDSNSLLKTLVSRLYVVKSKISLEREMIEANKFIQMPLKSRIDFLKELLAEKEEGEEEAVTQNSTRSKALKFLNALEARLHVQLEANFSGLLHPAGGTFPVQNSLPACLEHIFKVREFLRMPGSSAKSLMESVALVVPHFSN